MILLVTYFLNKYFWIKQLLLLAICFSTYIGYVIHLSIQSMVDTDFFNLSTPSMVIFITENIDNITVNTKVLWRCKNVLWNKNLLFVTNIKVTSSMPVIYGWVSESSNHESCDLSISHACIIPIKETNKGNWIF